MGRYYVPLRLLIPLDILVINVVGGEATDESGDKRDSYHCNHNYTSSHHRGLRRATATILYHKIIFGAKIICMIDKVGTL